MCVRASCFKLKFTDLHLKRTKTDSVFPGYVEHKETEPVQPNFSEFKLNELTWISTGQLIIDLYKAFEENEWGKHTIMSLSDLISNTSITSNSNCALENEPQLEEFGDEVVNENDGTQVPSPTTAENLSDEDKDNSNSNEDAKCSSSLDQQTILSADGSADDSDATKQNDANGSNKSKQSRRRGSDLKFLEQWGWHKTKKPPLQRRKNVEQNDAETSINGILRRILAKHFE